MFILAITRPGREFIYNFKTAHAVSKSSGEKIAAICNECRYKLQPGEIWHMYEVDQYDTAHDWACFHKFTIRNGIVKDVETYSYHKVW